MRGLIKFDVAVAIVFLSASAFAAGGGHGDGHIPWKGIAFQAANLGILLLALFFLIRKSVVEAFANRRKDYLDRSEKTKSALKDAEAALAGIKDKLNNLEGGEQKAIQNAQHEANLMKAGLIRDAETSAIKIKKDGQLMIANELNKARLEINNAILNQALTAATQTLSSKGQTGASAQETAFIQQLEQVKA